MRKGLSEQSARYRAVVKNRRALRERGMSRFEIRGLNRDKGMLRELARRLASNDQVAEQLRSELARQLAPRTDEPGGIWRWLRASPLVGSGINLEREVVYGRKIDL